MRQHWRTKYLGLLAENTDPPRVFGAFLFRFRSSNQPVLREAPPLRS